MSKLIFLALTCCILIAATNAVPFKAVTCADTNEVCKELGHLCNSVEQVRTICPVTCNSCGLLGLADACAVNNGGCDHYCSGTLKPQCSCRAGYELAADDKTCLDIDECNHETNPCSSEGLECVNTVGSYSCQKLNCENNLGASFRNYYKSDKCCEVQNDNLQSNALPEDHFSNKFTEASTNTAQWPWMAQVLNKSKQSCGATLVNHKWLVTSAKCVVSGDFRQTSIFLGNVKNAMYHDVSRSSQVERKIKQVIIHPNSLNNDIALIEMNQAVEFNNLIQPVRFPCGETPTVGQTCYVTGFGVKNDNRDAKPVRNLKQIGLPIVSSEYCATRYHGIDKAFNTTTNMCAGFKNGGEDACFGDGGSPLVCQRAESCEWYLSGIFSTGRGCGRPGFPGIYTNVVEYESWIQNEIKEDFSAFCPQKIVNRLIPQLG